VESRNPEREVIAHFEALTLVIQWIMTIGVVGVFLVWCKDLFLSGSDGDGARSSGPLMDGIGKGVLIWGFVIFAGALIFLMPALIKITRRTIAGGGAALWIENGRLVYVYREALDAPLADIAFVGVADLRIRTGTRAGTIHKNCLTIRLKSGKEINLPTDYAERIDSIVATLRQRIGLPDA
jgi:hypothetical protein